MEIKKINPPDPEEAIQDFLDHPDQVNSILVKYAFESLGAYLANKSRAEAVSESGELGEGLRLKRMRAVNLKGFFGECTAYVPELEGGAIAVIEEMEEAIDRLFEEAIYLFYSSGDSDRDIARDLADLGVTVSRTTVSKKYRAYSRRRFSEFMNQSFSGREFIDLQEDVMYIKVKRRVAPGVEEYRKAALSRAIGLNAGTGCFEPVSLLVLPDESLVGYGILFDRLRNQGLTNAYLVGTDFHSAFASTVGTGFPYAQWQGCVFHHEMNAAKRAGELFDEVVGAYRQVHGGGLSAPEAARAMAKKATEIGIVDAELSKALFRRLLATLAYLEYPKCFASEVSSNNRDERSNEEGRRREDPIRAFPSVGAALLLFWAVLSVQGQYWSLRPNTGGEAALAKASETHARLASAAFLETRREAEAYREYFDSPLTDMEAVAVWANIVNVPVLFGPATAMGVPFLVARVLDGRMESRLVALAPVQDASPAGVESAVFEHLLGRGIDSERVRLSITNRPDFALEGALLKAFPNSLPFSDPCTFIENVEYLTDSPEWPARELFGWVFRAGSFSEAKTRMEAFGKAFEKTGPEMAQWYCRWYGGERVINLYRMLDAGIWPGATPWDFRPHNNCVELVTNLCNNPVDAKKTMELLVKSFKRKRYTYKVPMAH